MRSRADIGRCMQHGGDRNLGISVAAQADEVCDRLPVPVVRAALVRYSFIEAESKRARSVETKPPPGRSKITGERRFSRPKKGRNGMCDRSVELDSKIVHYRRLRFGITDQATLDGIQELIERMEAQKAALHPEQ
jgi:hypothetical protein